MARLLALDAEVKAEVAAKQQKKDQQLALIRAELARREALKPKPAPAAPAPTPAAKAPAAKAPTAKAPAAKAAPRPVKERRPEPVADADDEDDDFLGGALALRDGAKLAKKAASAKQELERPREKGEKSWIGSSLLSLVLGPIGWLYAGSFREAIPASAGYLLAAAILSRLPAFLLMPVMMVAMPISAIAGLVYAIQYNRHGKRMRLFDREDEHKAKLKAGTKKLPAGD